MTSCKTSKYVVMSGLVTMQRILPLAGTITPAMPMFQISLVTYELEHLLMVNRRVLNTLSRSYSIRSVTLRMTNYKNISINFVHKVVPVLVMTYGLIEILPFLEQIRMEPCGLIMIHLGVDLVILPE